MSLAIKDNMKVGLLSFMALVLLIISSTGWIAAQETSETGNSSNMKSQNGLKVDVIFVLDNSGSMITNDPQFITREVVTNFLMNLQKQFRVGMVTFDSEASLIESLSSIDSASDTERFLKSLEKINYKGQYTNTPVGVERAIYELKSNGREAAEKSIILLTDGIVDTGNKAQDAAGEEWLKDQLARECKQAGIRIFGIAFTETADFRLIQTLALKTEGEYFRTFASTEIPMVFEKIEKIISKPKLALVDSKPVSKPEPVPIIVKRQSPAPPEAGAKRRASSPVPLLLTGLIVIVLVVVVLVYLNKQREISGITNQPSQIDQLRIQEQDPPKGEAEIIDADNVISETRLSVPVDKRVLKIGRDDSNDIVILKDSISSLHATIEYRNGIYYLIDQRSTNGTRLNNTMLKENTPMRLKSGDKIRFAVYEFRFSMPEMAPYGETVVVQNNSEPDLKKT